MNVPMFNEMLELYIMKTRTGITEKELEHYYELLVCNVLTMTMLNYN